MTLTGPTKYFAWRTEELREAMVEDKHLEAAVMNTLYRDLMHFRESIPLNDAAGEATLWEVVMYDRHEMARLNAALCELNRQCFALKRDRV